MLLGFWLRIPLKKIFMGKEKKAINVLTFFFSFPIKVISKLSFIRFLTNILKALVSISFFLNRIVINLICKGLIVEIKSLKDIDEILKWLNLILLTTIIGWRKPWNKNWRRIAEIKQKDVVALCKPIELKRVQDHPFTKHQANWSYTYKLGSIFLPYWFHIIHPSTTPPPPPIDSIIYKPNKLIFPPLWSVEIMISNNKKKNYDY